MNNAAKLRKKTDFDPFKGCFSPMLTILKGRFLWNRSVFSLILRQKCKTIRMQKIFLTAQELYARAVVSKELIGEDNCLGSQCALLS